MYTIPNVKRRNMKFWLTEEELSAVIAGVSCGVRRRRHGEGRQHPGGSSARQYKELRAAAGCKDWVADLARQWLLRIEVYRSPTQISY